MKAMIAMSGGVDSSVAAFLMFKKGYDCEGVTMRLFHLDEFAGQGGACNSRTCCSDRDVDDARRVTALLGIPHSSKDYSADFSAQIMDKFVRTYAAGGTPNPCIDCNRYMKFEKLLDYALSRGCELIVTGHYARVEKAGDRYLLKKGVDASKDQSYVLYNLTQEQLSHCAFPLGEYSKEQIRAIADEQGFVNAHKAESQDICFVPDGDYARFIEAYSGKTFPEGDFTDRDGHVLGRHKGIIHYTVGQRKGLNLPAEEPWYVTKLDTESNRVILSHGDGLFSDTLTAHDINLIALPRIEGELRCFAKIRYRQQEQPCVVTQPDEDTLRVVFDDPQRAITPGQALVLYDGDTVIGGGTIK